MKISKLLILFKYNNFKFIKIKSPPSSPDLNQIELAWADMKKFFTKKNCKKKEELVQAIFDFREITMAHYCQRFINLHTSEAVF